VLAKCLRDLPDPPSAFATYEGLRRNASRRLWRTHASVVATRQPTRWRGVFRDLMMPVVLKHFASEKAHEWMYRYHIDWDEKVG
jgi:FAD-dependent urate hydroxylase